MKYLLNLRKLYTVTILTCRLDECNRFFFSANVENLYSEDV